MAQFNQLEGLYVDKDVSLADLKGTLEFFLRELFGPDTVCRFRPHFFPFTEPSYEIDVKSAALKSGAEWLEIAGCGMVDPAVFQAINKARGDNAYDTEELHGFCVRLRVGPAGDDPERLAGRADAGGERRAGAGAVSLTTGRPGRLE